MGGGEGQKEFAQTYKGTTGNRYSAAPQGLCTVHLGFCNLNRTTLASRDRHCMTPLAERPTE